MNILLVEDDDVDAMTVKRASEDLNLCHNIVHVINGREALDYLLDANTNYPDLIILDINMPGMDGIEFLEQKAENKSLSIIPTVVLTTSNADSDRIRCYKLNISGYLIKPVDYKQFIKIYSIISDYWTNCEYPIHN